MDRSQQPVLNGYRIVRENKDAYMRPPIIGPHVGSKEYDPPTNLIEEDDYHHHIED